MDAEGVYEKILRMTANDDGFGLMVVIVTSTIAARRARTTSSSGLFGAFSNYTHDQFMRQPSLSDIKCRNQNKQTGDDELDHKKASAIRYVKKEAK